MSAPANSGTMMKSAPAFFNLFTKSILSDLPYIFILEFISFADKATKMFCSAFGSTAIKAFAFFEFQHLSKPYQYSLFLISLSILFLLINETNGFSMSKCFRRNPVLRVSSAITASTSFKIRIARKVISSRLPIGVGIM